MLERLNPDDLAQWARWSADHISRYAFATEYVRGRRVLDAGTGPGYGAALLFAAGAKEIVAIDCDAETVSAARARYGRDGIEFRVGDCETLEGIQPVDVICSFENIEHLPKPDRFIAAASRVLSPEGILLCSTPDRRGTPPFVNGRPANPFHVHEWYADEFLALIARGFEQVDLRAQVHGFGQSLREEAAKTVRATLQLHSEAIRNTLGNRLRRLAKQATGHSDWLAESNTKVQAVADQLAAASPADYPIVPAATAQLFGHPFCHFAICSKPRR